MHRERVAIPVQLDVSRASGEAGGRQLFWHRMALLCTTLTSRCDALRTGMGEDSVFIALLEAAPQEPGVGRLWATPEGLIVCCDAGFVTCFG